MATNYAGAIYNNMGSLAGQLLDTNSSHYQKYQSYLQKTMPGIGANTLMAPLMAGGTGYAGGQAIAKQRMAAMQGERQDKINTGVQGYALGNINIGANLLNQQGQLGLEMDQLAEQRRQYDESQGFGWGDFGSLAALVAAPFTGGASLMALPAMQGMQQLGGGNSRKPSPSGVGGY